MRTVAFHDRGTEGTIDASGVAQTFSFDNHYRSDLAVGAVVAAGVRFHAGHFAFLPEVRYTRWGSGDGTLRKNEAGLLLGITF